MANFFDLKEFACKCKDKNCEGKPPQLRMNPTLIQALNRIREELGKPIRVTSAFRCTAHNAAVGGVPHSTHRTGYAADIQCEDMDKLLELVEAEKEFRGIGVAKTFIHVDVRPTPRKRWTY
jgi:uncharacterized protein YcbK (DUF882 family)